MHIPHIKDIDVQGKRVLVRVDFNVSLRDDHTIANDSRIKEAIPTISYLLAQKATVILVSHLGRPRGERDPALSLSGVAKHLERYIRHRVILLDDFQNPGTADAIKQAPKGTVFLCENIRFYPGEEVNDPVFASQLASLAEIFVNDAFGTAHRAHASTVGVTAYLPSYSGLLFAKEVMTISAAIRKPKRPLVVIVGGGKTPEKIRVIEKLLDIADTIYLGGAIANTFFATWGIGVGISRVDHEMIEMARNVLWKATRVHARLLLPCDVIVTNEERTTKPLMLCYDKVPLGLGIYDIGPQSLSELSDIIAGAKTIIWNGPMGLYEDDRFAKGTNATFAAIAKSRAHTIIGGGDTIATIRDEALIPGIDLISTGGGAMLEFIEKGTLPTIEALQNGIKHHPQTQTRPRPCATR